MPRTALRRRSLAVLAVASAAAGTAALPSPAAAGPRPADPSAADALTPRVALPGSGARAATSGGRWIVGARPGEAATTIALAHGAEPLRIAGTFSVPVGKARALADELRAEGLLRFAEPNAPRERSSAFEAAPGAWARSAVVPLATPLPASLPPIGVVDDLVDVSHPDVAANTRLLDPKGVGVVEGPHGTMVASAAAAAVNGVGVFGVLPGAPIISYGVPTDFGCEESSDGIAGLADAGAKVIVLSYGSPMDCLLEYLGVAYAYAKGAIVVAASGNEFQAGNPVLYPAAWPHVLSVSAIDELDQSSYFSSANAGVDVSAPGERVPLAVPLAFEEDGVPDGLAVADGTSFAAPIVAGAAAWVKGARPSLDNGQVDDVLRRSAVDLGPGGWDPDTGFGRVDIPRALAEPAPRSDPREPNDLIGLVNGEYIEKVDPYIWKGSGTKRLRANVDAIKDPTDIYRIRLPKRSRAKILVRPTSGDADLQVYDATADYIGQPGERIGVSRRSGSRTEKVTIRNRTGRARTAYVVAEVGQRATVAEAPYRLEVTRMKYR